MRFPSWEVATIATVATWPPERGAVLQFPQAWHGGQTIPPSALSIRQASAHAAPRKTVPASWRTSQPFCSKMPSAALAFGLSRNGFGPSRTTSRTSTSVSAPRADREFPKVSGARLCGHRLSGQNVVPVALVAGVWCYAFDLTISL